MPTLQWGANIELGVPAMDEQHRRLIELMHELRRLAADGACGGPLGVLFEELVALSLRHCDDEERYMAAIDYPERRAHAAVHDEMLGRLFAYRNEYLTGNGRLPPGFLRFLVYWWSAHIQGIDRKYAGRPMPV